MPQKALPSSTLVAAVRTSLGLPQELLGVSRGQIAHVEAGRRPLRGEAAHRLRVLTLLLLPPLGPAPPPPLPTTSTLFASVVAALRRRRARCRWQSANMERQLERWQQQLTQGRPALLPTLLAVLPVADSQLTAALTYQRLVEWATAPVGAAGFEARGILLALRIRSMQAEAAALTEWLSTTAGAAT